MRQSTLLQPVAAFAAPSVQAWRDRQASVHGTAASR